MPVDSSKERRSQQVGADGLRSASATRIQVQAVGLIDEHKKTAQAWQRRSVAALAIGLVACGAILAMNVVGNQMFKKSKPSSDSELRSTDGRSRVDSLPQPRIR